MPIINRLFIWEVGFLVSNNIGNKILFHSGKAVLWQFQKINLAETLGRKRDAHILYCKLWVFFCGKGALCLNCSEDFVRRSNADVCGAFTGFQCKCS